MHSVRGDWGAPALPCVPGHEIVGRVAVVGPGGLGHMAVKLAVAQRAEVHVLTTTPGKVEAARAMGASAAYLWQDAQARPELKNHFDLILSTVP